MRPRRPSLCRCWWWARLLRAPAGRASEDHQDPGSHDRELHRSASDVSQDRLRHEQLPYYPGQTRPGSVVPVIGGPKHAGVPLFLGFFRHGYQNQHLRSIRKCPYCSAITVQHWPEPGKGAADSD